MAARAHEMRIVLDIAGRHIGTMGFDGYAASSFMGALCDAIFKADGTNRAKLRVVFPDLVDAVEHYETQPLERSLALAREGGGQ